MAPSSNLFPWDVVERGLGWEAGRSLSPSSSGGVPTDHLLGLKVLEVRRVKSSRCGWESRGDKIVWLSTFFSSSTNHEPRVTRSDWSCGPWTPCRFVYPWWGPMVQGENGASCVICRSGGKKCRSKSWAALGENITLGCRRVRDVRYNKHGSGGCHQFDGTVSLREWS